MKSRAALAAICISVPTAGCDVTAVLGTGAGVPSQAVGVWVDVTPADVHLEPDYNAAGNFGVQDVLVDPAKPSDLYAFICYQGVWRSSDYGLTWTKVSTGTSSAALDSGRPWTAGIDSNAARDPATPPTLYTANGYGNEHGNFKSIDGGVNWTHQALPEPAIDPSAIDVDPYDGAHLIAGVQAATGLLESTDGGETWIAKLATADLGETLYAFFIDTGDPVTTRTTWLTQATVASGSHGMWRTADAGATFERVESLEHFLGNSQIVQRNSTIYAAGAHGTAGDGVYRSTDLGLTWESVHVGNQAIVFGTARFTYAAAGGASEAPVPPDLVRSAAADGVTWSTQVTPEAMNYGPKRVAVTEKSGHAVLVAGSWLGGIWRFVE